MFSFPYLRGISRVRVRNRYVCIKFSAEKNISCTMYQVFWRKDTKFRQCLKHKIADFSCHLSISIPERFHTIVDLWEDLRNNKCCCMHVICKTAAESCALVQTQVFGLRYQHLCGHPSIPSLLPIIYGPFIEIDNTSNC